MIESTDWTHLWVLLSTLPILILTIAAIIATIRSHQLSTGAKIAWVAVLLVPIGGLLLWTPFWWSRRQASAREHAPEHGG